MVYVTREDEKRNYEEKPVEHDNYSR